MAYVGFLLIVVANSIILFFLSFLAAGGDGSKDGILRVWLVGYAWIGIFSVVALVLCLRGKRASGLMVASSALPTGFVASLLFVIVGGLLGYKIG